MLDDSAPTKKSDVVELFSCGDVKKNPEVVIRIVKDNETLEDDRRRRDLYLLSVARCGLLSLVHGSLLCKRGQFASFSAYDS